MKNMALIEIAPAQWLSKIKIFLNGRELFVKNEHFDILRVVTAIEYF